MIERGTVLIKKLASNLAEKKRFERWIRHKDVTTSRLIATEQARVKELCEGVHVLGVQDTTEINYASHQGRVKELGTVGNGKDAGFFMHPLVVLDAKTGGCLGSAEITLWNRTEKAKDDYAQLPIEEKESYRWVETAIKAKKTLAKARAVTFIGDRENDIYEYYARIPDEKTHVITRVRDDRLLENNVDKKLYRHLDKTKEAGRFTFELKRDSRLNRVKRDCILGVKYAEIEIKRPSNCSDKKSAGSIKLRVVEAQEIDCPAGEEKVHWRLYTTHAVSGFEEARQIIEWYQMRWNIEQIFRTMKSQGLDIESSMVESGANLMKLGVLALCAATQIIQLVRAREGKTEQKTATVFTLDERVFLTVLLKKVEGKTQKQHNPYPKENLAWAAWIIARLGSWHGPSEGPPGPIVMGRGRQRFYEMYAGFNLYKDLSS